MILAWNVFQHFYPYFDVVEVDWPAVLREALARAAEDKDEQSFRDTLRSMVARLQDGHAAVFWGGRRPTHQLPLGWGWVEGRLRVTALASGLDINLAPGDIVERIADRPALDAITAAEALQGGPTDARRRFSALRELLSGAQGETVKLRVQSTRSPVVDLRLQRTVAIGAVPLERRPAAIADVAPGILYVDLTRIGDSQVAGVLPRLVAACGVVLDVRGYPQPTQAFLGHLSDRPLVGGSGCVPIVRLPDRKDMAFACTESKIEPSTPRVRAPLVFLTDTRAMSCGETIMAAVEAGRLGPIVGSETAGTNGNVHAFALPGGYQIKWTPMRVTKPDGQRLHGIGVHPTVRTNRTADDVAARKDSGLAKALEILRGQSPSAETPSEAR